MDAEEAEAERKAFEELAEFFEAMAAKASQEAGADDSQAGFPTIGKAVTGGAAGRGGKTAALCKRSDPKGARRIGCIVRRRATGKSWNDARAGPRSGRGQGCWLSVRPMQNCAESRAGAATAAMKERADIPLERPGQADQGQVGLFLDDGPQRPLSLRRGHADAKGWPVAQAARHRPR